MAPIDNSDKLDRLLMETNDIRVHITHIDAKLTQHIEHTIPDMKKQLHSQEDRLRAVEMEGAANKVKLGLWGGIAGLVAIVWQTISFLT